MTEAGQFQFTPYWPPKRDLVGYGANPPNPNWPNGAKIAVQIVINYEEGGENTVVNGDKRSETNLQEFGTLMPGVENEIDPGMHTQFEYGSRAGMWRLLRLFDKYKFPVTIYAVGKAYEQAPDIVEHCTKAGHEHASHCHRWLSYTNMPAEEEEKYIRAAVESFKKTTGKVPVGWYYGRPSSRSCALVAKVYKELGHEFLYWSDNYADDLPYWEKHPTEGGKEGLLMMPYSLDCNDFKFFVGPGFASTKAFEEHMINAFDTIYQEGVEGSPKYITVALHARYLGRPGRFPAIANFCKYISEKEGVWVATREQIARHWAEQYPYKPEA